VRSSSTLLSRSSRTQIGLHSAIHNDGDDDSAAESHTHLLSPQNFLMLVLFPRILIIREYDDEELVFGKTAFRNSKAATAAQELREDIDARRPKRGTSRKERKIMITGCGSTPASPTKLKTAHFSEYGMPGGFNGNAREVY
jgi:hypothetical protein